MTKPETMTCTHCGRRRSWPDGFPNRAYAECWTCASERFTGAIDRAEKKAVTALIGWALAACGWTVAIALLVIR